MLMQLLMPAADDAADALMLLPMMPPLLLSNDGCCRCALHLPMLPGPSTDTATDTDTATAAATVASICIMDVLDYNLYSSTNAISGKYLNQCCSLKLDLS